MPGTGHEGHDAGQCYVYSEKGRVSVSSSVMASMTYCAPRVVAGACVGAGGGLQVALKLDPTPIPEKNPSADTLGLQGVRAAHCMLSIMDFIAILK